LFQKLQDSMDIMVTGLDGSMKWILNQIIPECWNHWVRKKGILISAHLCVMDIQGSYHSPPWRHRQSRYHISRIISSSDIHFVIPVLVLIFKNKYNNKNNKVKFLYNTTFQDRA
jgi:hypothetical protein